MLKLVEMQFNLPDVVRLPSRPWPVAIHAAGGREPDVVGPQGWWNHERGQGRHDGQRAGDPHRQPVRQLGVGRRKLFVRLQDG